MSSRDADLASREQNVIVSNTQRSRAHWVVVVELAAEREVC
jgi:hypothetical protein